MKMILFKILIMALFAAIFPACIDKGENVSLPKEEETPTPSKPEDEPDFSQLTADNHPRLLMNADDFAELKNKLKSRESAHLALLHNTIIDLCNSKGMNTDELVYKLDDSNKRILDVSRDALLRIFTCAYAYRMTGENKYLLKAERDMNAVCNFSDWNAKRHFLDVAEMATAIAFGYDWLYHDLSEMTRTKASDALLKFAIQQAQRKNWNLNFYEATNNWNQVCNGGLVCAAVAAFENYPLEARNIIEKAVVSNKPALQVMYAPDGNYPEGSGYWCYGTLYQVLMLAALKSTVGTDYGLSDTPGFSKTAEYMLYMTGVRNELFNYSDCAPSSTVALAVWWFADAYNNPSLLYNELRALMNGEYASSSENRLLPLVMAFAKNLNLNDVPAPTNRIWSGKGETPVVMVHTDWTYTDTDKYLGIKGGKAETNHGHMDAGSFVYEAYGVRWSMDFGMQSYETLEPALIRLGGSLWDMGQNSLRWNVFRLNNLNHSTLSVNDARHRVDGTATLSAVINTESELGATFNLTDVLSDQVASAVRTVKIVDNKKLLVVDEVETRNDKPAKVRWCMVTPAIPTVETDRIVLVKGDKVMYLTVDGTVKPIFKVWSTASENSYDQPNPDTYMVGFEVIVPALQTATFTTVLMPKRNK